MSETKPPSDSGQPIANGGSTQTNQSAEFDFLNQKDLMLKLSFDEVPKNGNEHASNARKISVTGEITLLDKNPQQSQIASILEYVRTGGDDSTFQSFQHLQQNYDSKSQDMNFINNSLKTFNETSKILSNCSENIEKLKAELKNLSENREIRNLVKM